MRAFALVLIALTAAGCRGRDLSEWVERQRVARAEVEKAVGSVPYGEAEFQVFQAYFQPIEMLAQEVTLRRSKAKELARALESASIVAVCEALVLPETTWTALLANCSRAGYSICPWSLDRYRQNLETIASAVGLSGCSP